MEVFDNRFFDACAISLWFRSDSLTEDQQIIFQGAFLGFGVFINAEGRLIGFYDGNSENSLVSESSLVDGKWHHVVVQSDGSMSSLYLDGRFVGSQVEAFMVGSGSPEEKLYIGRSNLNIQPFFGGVNDIRVYNRILDDCEIQSLAGNFSPSFLEFPFDGSLDDVGGQEKNLEEISGTLSYELFREGDSALVLDGNSGASSIEPFDNSSFIQEAVAFWAKTSTVTFPSDQLMVQGAFSGFGAFIEANTGNLGVFMDASSEGSLISAKPIADGEWHYIVFQSNGSTTELYIDGEFEASQEEILFVGEGDNPEAKIYIGRSNLDTRHFTGSLNHLRIYNRILTVCEIDSLASQDLTTFTPKLINQLDARVFPNPSLGTFSVALPKRQSHIFVTLLDPTGREVLKREYDRTDKLSISASHIPVGMYFLVIEAGGKWSYILLELN